VRGGTRTALTWTPDGQALVFVGRRRGVQQLHVRRLDAAEARPLAGTENAQAPAVSPDGQWVAFWADGSIKKVSLGGGPVVDLASGTAYPPAGLAWGTAGGLFFSADDRRIWRIPPTGAPAAVTTPGDAEVRHCLPYPLPGEQVLLYTVRKRSRSWGDEEIVAQTLATGARKTLLVDAADARYVPTGHLVFLRRGVLYAVPFDAERVRIVGKEMPVLDTVAQALTAGNSNDVTGAGQFAVAATGTLAWVAGPVEPYPEGTLVTIDRHGQIVPLPARAWNYGPTVRLSPDGRRMTVIVRTPTDGGIWVYDVLQGGLTARARGGETLGAFWSPDGQRLVFNWLMGGRFAVTQQPADGTAPAQALVSGNLDPSSFTPDGRHILAVRDNRDICLVAIEPGQARVQPLTEPPNTELWPEISPDGRWLAYGSTVSGRFEVYVRPYPGPGAPHQVSLDGGQSPAWDRRGGELYYLSGVGADGKRQMMVVDITTASAPRIGRPRTLFTFDNGEVNLACATVRCFDVAPDGQRFYGVKVRTPPPPTPVTHIELITNWFQDLRAKAPAR
jgi:serine/threonine-protein kinase